MMLCSSCANSIVDTCVSQGTYQPLERRELLVGLFNEPALVCTPLQCDLGARLVAARNGVARDRIFLVEDMLQLGQCAGLP